MSELPLATVVVPARNEIEDIERCLEHILAQDYPRDALDVIVVDGCSSDGTAEAARRTLAGSGLRSVSVVSNDRASTPSNLNLGLSQAHGEIVCRVDARTLVQADHVRICADVLATRPDVAVVGGAQVAIARRSTAQAIGIARALNNRWSMGGSRYRRAARSGPADTVYLGAFRRADLLRVGGWDERLPSNQDFDLNQRMMERGLVWFEARLRSGYLPRSSFRELWLQYRRFGRAKVDYWRTTGDRPQPRQWMIILGPTAALLSSATVLWAASTSVRLSFVGAWAVAMLVVEAVGSDEPEPTAGGHLAAAVAMVLIGAGWWTGLVRRVAGSSRSQPEVEARMAPGRSG